MSLDAALAGLLARLSALERAVERLGVGEVPRSVYIAARAYHANAQTLAHNTLTAIAFDTESFDTDGMHSTSSSGGAWTKLTCVTAGLYFLAGHLEFTASAGGSLRSAYLRVNGSTYVARDYQPPGAGVPQIVIPHTLYRLAVDDYVELIGFQDSGGNLNTGHTSGITPAVWAVRLGA